MATDFNRLKAQCDSLKLQRQTLGSDCTALTSDRDSLQSELAKLQSECDSLRIELAKEHHENTWWAQRDIQASASTEFDGVGKLNRRIWVLEGKNSDLTQQLKEVEEGKEKDVGEEKAVSMGLRDRIGRLEEKIQRRDIEIQEGLERERNLQYTAKSEREALEFTFSISKIGWEDMKEALAKEKREVRRLTDEVTRLSEQKQEAWEELKKLKEIKTVPIT
jgi:chromosome segregation ATPase